MTPLQLKNSIVQLALQGKLVKQDQLEGTADELLRSVEKTFRELIKKKEIKKLRSVGACGNDETPFELPSNWKWVKWGQIVNVVSARRVHQSDWKHSGVPFYRAREISKLSDCGFVNNELFISEELFSEFTKQRAPKPGDLMVTAVGTLGKTYVVRPTDRFYYKDASVICLENIGNLNPYYLKLVLESPLTTEQIRGNSSGTTVSTLTIDRMNEYLVPLPPLGEQDRIVAKIEELMPLVDEYEKLYNRLESLNQSFPVDLAKSLIQFALQGKLVNHDSSEGTGEGLYLSILKRRKALVDQGRIKREKPLPAITEDDIPFEIPSNWTWAHIGELFNHNTGKALNSSDREGRSLEYITTSNVYWNSFVLDKLKTMLFTEDEEKRCSIKKGDLLVLEGGDVGRAAIWEFDFPMRIQNHIHRLRPFEPLSMKFFYYVFFLYKATGRIAGKGIGIQGLSAGALHNLVVPLPPLAEQERIVAELDRLLPLCDSLTLLQGKEEREN